MNEGPNEVVTSGQASVAACGNLELLLDLQLPVTLRFGRAEMPLADIVGLDSRSIIELDRGLDEPIEILVNGRLIARGEPVIVQGSYGVRILEIASQEDRLETTSRSSPKEAQRQEVQNRCHSTGS
jgi:flagellar motor switch protein FliN